MSLFRRLLSSSRPLILDGGMGTMLQSRGLPPGENPERFCLARPDVLQSIQADYVRAGSDMILTCTFGGSPFKLPGDVEVESFNEQMARVARKAATEAGGGRDVLIGGDIGPSGHFPAPLGDVSPLDMLEAYRRQVRGLVRGGVDLIFVETQFDLAELRLIVAAVRAECDLPIAVSMTFEEGVSLTGTTPEIFAATMANMGVDAVGVNCGAGPDDMQPVVDQLLACAQAPVFVEPNAGLPELVEGQTLFRLEPRPFAEATCAFVRQGARMVGGCCGTTPDHIAALRQAVEALGDLSQRVIPERPGVILTSRSRLVRLGPDQPFRLIGERINPTGKKQLQAEFAAGEVGLALQFASEQIEAGAPILDVNAGAPLADEIALLPKLIRELSARHAVPLSLDSSNGRAIEAALPFFPGSCLINSISGEPGRMELLGPLCRTWGAPCILLPIQGRDLPVRAVERIAVIERLVRQAEAMGLHRRLLVVDVLALAAASEPSAATEGLETIRWCTAQGIPTVIGLSNISFGLPARELVNTAFLSMCAGAGLSGCIANPGSARIREAVAAADVLLGKDDGASRFVSGYSGWTPGEGGPAATGGSQGAGRSETLEQAVLAGDKDHILDLVEAELAAGAQPYALVNERLIPAITEVGSRYERKEYFLPQLLRSAETMQTAFARLKPLLETDSDARDKPLVILATVEGDIHDIGKNIVALMLGNHGYDVLDLGKDVTAETIVNVAQERGAALIGLSALMTTTMVRMEDAVRLLRERGLSIKVLVGGAVVTSDFADRIGADGYAADAVEAVREAGRVLGDEAASPVLQ